MLPLVAAAIMFAAVCAYAGNVKIIANPSVRADSITAAEIRGVFAEDKKSLNDGSHVEPVLAKGGPAHEAFLRDLLGKSDSELQTHYRTLVFTGTGAMPKFLDSDAAITSYVARTKGAIGYVSIDAPTDGVKVLAISRAGDNSTRHLVVRVEPEYPPTLQQLGIHGTVRLQLSISSKGSVEEVMVLGGNPILAEAAVKAAKQWIYAPGPRTTIEVAIPFESKH
jgi:TonB family protein